MIGLDSIGEGISKICYRLATNQDIAKLLVNTSSTPLNIPDIDLEDETTSILYKNITDVPYVDETEIKAGMIVVVTPSGDTNENLDFSDCGVSIDVILPLDMWRINHKSNRPILLMSKIVDCVNGSVITGIGTLQYNGYDLTTITDKIGIYSMRFEVSVGIGTK